MFNLHSWNFVKVNTWRISNVHISKSVPHNQNSTGRNFWSLGKEMMINLKFLARFPMTPFEFDHVSLHALQFHGRESAYAFPFFGSFFFQHTTPLIKHNPNTTVEKVFLNHAFYIHNGSVDYLPTMLPGCSCQCRRFLQVAWHFSKSHQEGD